MRRVVSGLLLAAALPAAVLAQPGEVRFSGRVTGLEAGAGRLVVEELGEGRDGTPVSRRRVVGLVPETSVELLERSAQAGPGAWPGGFRARPLEADRLRPGDFVTVVAFRRDGGLTARLVSVVRPAP